LRPPELNPLLNPLLAENMGRWAEVYFTSPPEKRDEAVLELLRELEAKKSGQEASVPVPTRPDFSRYNPARETAPVSSKEAPVEHDNVENDVPVVRCVACGRENPESHKFCGMCGARLDAVVRDEPPATAEREYQQPEPEPSYQYIPSNSNGLSLFQDSGDRSYEDYSDYEYEPERSSSSRIYVGLALALLIVALGYFAWRSDQSSQASQGPPPPPPAAVKEAEPTSAAPKADGEQPPSTAPAQKSAQAPSSEASNKQAPADVSPQNKAARAEQTARVTPPPATTNDASQDQSAPTNANVDNGRAELATAQRYLNGTAGQRRDSAEAAKWLWRSIAKHNSEATVALADLYLKGDGVSKNCDQARILLDSAARKGTAGAGERLRNLPAFGCQ
jgi:hypothetical protein